MHKSNWGQGFIFEGELKMELHLSLNKPFSSNLFLFLIILFWII